MLCQPRCLGLSGRSNKNANSPERGMAETSASFYDPQVQPRWSEEQFREVDSICFLLGIQNEFVRRRLREEAVVEDSTSLFEALSCVCLGSLFRGILGVVSRYQRHARQQLHKCRWLYFFHDPDMGQHPISNQNGTQYQAGHL